LKIIRDRSRKFHEPGVKQSVSDFVGEALGAKETGERGHDDQERKKLHPRRQRDVAGDRLDVAFVETKKSVERDTKHAGQTLRPWRQRPETASNRGVVGGLQN